MIKWILFALCVLTSVVCGDEIPQGPSTPVPPVPTQEQVNRALLTRYVELSVVKAHLRAELQELNDFLDTWEWMIDELEPGPFRDLLIIACRHAHDRISQILIEIVNIDADLDDLRKALGW